MRLIDADVIRANLMKYIGLTNGFDKAFDETPIIEERKKGEWQSIKSYPNIIFCNECGTPFMRDSTIWNFCPDCGADMREESEVEE